MKLAVVALLAGSAVAFLPAPVGNTAPALRCDGEWVRPRGDDGTASRYISHQVLAWLEKRLLPFRSDASFACSFGDARLDAAEGYSTVLKCWFHWRLFSEHSTTCQIIEMDI